MEHDIPEPPAGSVRIKVQACGVCHSDSLTKDGTWPGINYPRVPGHEVAGIIDAVGAAVLGWETGQKVGVGWFGGNCGYCDSCRRGDISMCQNVTLVTGISFDGGYADYLIAPATALALIPPELSAVEAAPLMCAGVTTLMPCGTAGRGPARSWPSWGSVGLAISVSSLPPRWDSKRLPSPEARTRRLWPSNWGPGNISIAPPRTSPRHLGNLGGAKVILATVTNSQAMAAVVGGLGVDGKLIIVGASAEPLEVYPLALIVHRLVIAGWYSGAAIDSQDTMAFSVLTGVRSMSEVFPLERAPEAYERMMSGKARFRVVLTTE